MVFFFLMMSFHCSCFLSVCCSCIFVCLFGFLTSSPTTRLYRGRAPFLRTILRAATHETELGDHDFCLSRLHYTDNDPPIGSGRSQRESNPGPPHQETRALPTELPSYSFIHFAVARIVMLT